MISASGEAEEKIRAINNAYDTWLPEYGRTAGARS